MPATTPQVDVTGVKRYPPAVTYGATAQVGTSPPAMVMGAGSDDDRGTVTFGTGTGVTTVSSAGSPVLTFTFANPKDPNRLPVVQVSETTPALALLDVVVLSVTSTGFTVGAAVVLASSQAATVYGVTWSVID